MRRIVPLAPLVAVVLLALLPAGAARADDEAPRSNQFSIDLDAASAGVTYASRIGQSRVLLGGGGGLGFSPLLGKTIATGTHYDEPDVLQVFEVVNLQFFARLELVSWLRVDTGVRAGAFIHFLEKPRGGEFAALFVAPALAWRWLWVGPRVSAGVLTEGDGPTAGMLSIDYLMLRLVRSW